MSDVGGVFGLYIGLTLVGFIELLEMGAMSVYYWYLAKRRQNRQIHFGRFQLLFAYLQFQHCSNNPVRVWASRSRICSDEHNLLVMNEKNWEQL